MLQETLTETQLTGVCAVDSSETDWLQVASRAQMLSASLKAATGGSYRGSTPHSQESAQCVYTQCGASKKLKQERGAQVERDALFLSVQRSTMTITHLRRACLVEFSRVNPIVRSMTRPALLCKRAQSQSNYRRRNLLPTLQRQFTLGVEQMARVTCYPNKTIFSYIGVQNSRSFGFYK